MEVTRQSIHERQIALIQHYLERVADLAHMHARGKTAAQEALRVFDQEWQQLQAQQQWAAKMALKDRKAAALVASFADAAGELLMQVEIPAALKWVEDALQWSDITDLKQRHRLVLRGYDLYNLLMNMERGRELLDEAETLVEKIGDDVLRSDLSRLNIGYYEAIGDHVKQLEWAENSLKFALRLEDQVQIAKAYHKLGFVTFWLDQYSRAEGYLKTSLDLFQQAGLRMNTAAVYNALSCNAYYWGKSDQVMPYGELGLAIAREYGRRDIELVIFTNMGLFLSGLGNLEKALQYGLQGLATAVEAGSRKAEFTALGTILLTASRLGLAHEVSVYSDRALARMNELPKSDELYATVEWARWYIAHEQGDWHTARTYGEEMIVNARMRSKAQAEHAAAGSLADSLVELGELDAAAQGYLRGLEIRNETYENSQERAHELIGLSRVETLRGNHEQAQKLFDDFFALLTEHKLENLSPPFMVAWSAYQAATALDDPRVSIILEEFEKLLDTYVSYIQDERLRASFLNQFSLRSLMSVRSSSIP